MSKYLDGEGWEDESETDNVKIADLPPEQQKAWMELARQTDVIAARLALLKDLGKRMTDRKATAEQREQAKAEFREFGKTQEAYRASLTPISVTSPSDKA